MTERILLVTGFEPFGGDPRNPSSEMAAALDGKLIGGCRVHGAILPVNCRTMPDQVKEMIGQYVDRLAGVVHLGLANGRAVVGLERVAINCLDFPIPDQAGHQPLGEPCVPGGPAAYFNTLPIRHALAALREAGIPSVISNTAGTYLCNQVMYMTLHLLATQGRNVPAGFVHIPYLPEQVAARGAGLPSLSFEVIKAAAELILLKTATVPMGESGPVLFAGSVC